ncbi:MAG: DUF3977 family protein [Candidatus Neomarinimicrobiota bacterium]|nr:DUF3977 family protein [Candidatus Neomarinimicrobiota bacterium]
MDFKGVYLRIWFGKTVIIISKINGFKTQIKNRGAFKALIGIQGWGSGTEQDTSKTKTLNTSL